MKFRNVEKAKGIKRPYNILEDLKKARTINELPQFIPPLNLVAIEAMKEWIMKIHNRLGENGVLYNVEKLYGVNVIHLRRVRIPGYAGRKNVLYTVYDDKVNFFSLYELKTNLKGIDQTITQFLVYRDSKNNHNGISSISLNRVAWNIVFPITNSFLCDKQQTEFGRKSWEFIVEQAYEKGLNVYVYDSKDKVLHELEDFEEYLHNINRYYGTQKDYQRYQVLIRKE